MPGGLSGRTRHLAVPAHWELIPLFSLAGEKDSQDGEREVACRRRWRSSHVKNIVVPQAASGHRQRSARMQAPCRTHRTQNGEDSPNLTTWLCVQKVMAPRAIQTRDQYGSAVPDRGTGGESKDLVGQEEGLDARDRTRMTASRKEAHMKGHMTSRQQSQAFDGCSSKRSTRYTPLTCSLLFLGARVDVAERGWSRCNTLKKRPRTAGREAGEPSKSVKGGGNRCAVP